MRRLRKAVSTLAVVLVTLAVAPAALASNPGDWTQQDINGAIASGVDFLMTQQDLTGTPGSNANYGRFGSSYPVTETAMAIISFGVLDQGHFANLDASQKASLKAGVDWLLKQQDLTGDASTNSNHGSWNVGLQNYDTALAISALSFSGDVPSDPALQSVGTAMQKGRAWEIAHQTWPSSCDPPNPTDTSQASCGGFTYYSNPGSGADASNTGFSMTGIELTGGVPAQVAQRNLIWQRKVQEIASNPVRHGTANNGCGSYEPGFGSAGGFAYANANDTGTLLFGYGYDGLTGSDAGVQAALACGNHLLSTYELSKDNRVQIAEHSDTLDPPCHVGDSGCTYVQDTDGGYHYSMFSLSKGIGQFTAPSLTNPNNFYAKVVDLLLSQQDTSNTATKGSWPPDGRDDATSIVATGFSILALGRVGQPATISGTVYNDKNGDGNRDAGEGGQNGVTVYLDKNNDGNPDAGEPKAVTGSTGAYTISDIEPGNYPALREVRPAGFNCTQPSPCRYAPISLQSGQSLTARNFGNHKPPAGNGPGPPQAGKNFNITATGDVTVKCPGQPPQKVGQRERKFPLGCTVDATHGTAHLRWNSRCNGIATGDISGSPFVVRQFTDTGPAECPGGLILDLKVLSTKPTGCDDTGRDNDDKLSKANVTGHLHVKTKRRRVRSRHRHSSGTVRGTEYDVVERCDGTFTRVIRGVVAVRDFRLKKTFLVHAGKSYLARVPGGGPDREDRKPPPQTPWGGVQGGR